MNMKSKSSWLPTALVGVVATAVLTFAVLPKSVTSASGLSYVLPSATATPCVPVPTVNDKCPVWTSSYDGPAHSSDGPGSSIYPQYGRVMATSPDGHVVYVAGYSQRADSNKD